MANLQKKVSDKKDALVAQGTHSISYVRACVFPLGMTPKRSRAKHLRSERGLLCPYGFPTYSAEGTGG